VAGGNPVGICSRQALVAGRQVVRCGGVTRRQAGGWQVQSGAGRHPTW